MKPISPVRAATVATPALGMFALLAAAVHAGRATGLDMAVSRWMELHSQPWVTRMLFLVTEWHQTAGVLVMAAAVLAWLWRRREHAWSAALVLAVPGGMLLNVLLKWTFQRGRPRFDEPLVHLLTYSFPSGHTLGATVFYGFLAVYLHAHVPRPAARAAIVAGAAAMILLVALSRVYLGAHFPTDVLAAMAEGVLWLTICMTLVSHWRSRRSAGAASASS